MAKRQIKTQFIGSFLGFAWTFLNPLVMIFILWFIFSVGFKAQPRGNVPFVVWLAAGMAIWNAFNDVVNGSLAVIIENQTILKKTPIPAHILSVARVVSSSATHLVYLGILLTLIFFYRLPVSLFCLQFLYYFAAMCVLGLGVGWFVSAINVFVRDTAHIVGLALQFLFWMTPIMWDISIIPPRYHLLLKLNPLFYLVQGYRDSFFYAVPFWEHGMMSLYYWVVAAVCLVLGGVVFRKAKPHFADVL